jgi:NAD(P)H-hydrate epimerase
MYIIDKKKCKQIDKTAVIEYKYPEILLMENASLFSFDVIKNEIKDLKNKSIAIVCLNGNNGGDGLALARHLYNYGAKVTIYYLFDKTKIDDFKDSFKINFDIIENIENIKKIEIIKEDDIKVDFFNEDIIIDAIFGIGIDRDIEGYIEKVITNINDKNSKIVFSLDIPSGINSNTGQIYNVCIKADYTISFIAPKIGFYTENAGDFVGKIFFSNISIFKDIFDNFKIKYYLNNLNEIKKILKIKNQFLNKYSVGNGLAIAGSIGLTGAAVLLCKACFKSGIGLLTLAIPKSLNHIMEIKLLETMTLPLNETLDGTISVDAVEEVIKKFNKIDALAIGPGISKKFETLEFVKNVVLNFEKPIVIDADALSIFENRLEIFNDIKNKIILTPHIKEFSRIINKSVDEILKNKFEIVSLFTKQYPNVILILKGRYTLISENGIIYVNTLGNVGMAKAGSGDILTGIILSFLSQKIEPFEAAKLAVFIHSLAGDLAAKKNNQFSMIPSDIIDFLPEAFNILLES